MSDAAPPASEVVTVNLLDWMHMKDEAENAGVLLVFYEATIHSQTAELAALRADVDGLSLALVEANKQLAACTGEILDLQNERDRLRLAFNDLQAALRDQPPPGRDNAPTGVDR